MYERCRPGGYTFSALPLTNCLKAEISSAYIASTFTCFNVPTSSILEYVAERIINKKLLLTGTIEKRHIERSISMEESFRGLSNLCFNRSTSA